MWRRTGERDGAGRLGRPAGLPNRWSAQRKSEVVLRLLRGRGHRRGEPGDAGSAPKAGAMAAGVPARGPAGSEGEEPAGRRADANPGEAWGDDDVGRVAGGGPQIWGYGNELRKLLKALGRVSPPKNRPYARTMVCETWRVARSSVYALRARLEGPPRTDRREPGKRWRKTAASDEELVEEIRMVLRQARLAARGIQVGKNRVLRLMRETGCWRRRGGASPEGTGATGGRIRTGRPDELWGTDASRFWTKAEDWCWFFAAVDRCTLDVVGWHVAKKGDQLGGAGAGSPGGASLHERLRQGDRTGSRSAARLGSQYRPRQFQAEIKWLGIRSTPAYVGEPECNGVAERFIRTLKEECIHLHDFETLEEARAVIGTFGERYNNGGLLQRHGYMIPARAREQLSRKAA